jgi:hypothetical protein
MVSGKQSAAPQDGHAIQEDLDASAFACGFCRMEFGVMMDAVLQTRKFDAALWASRVATPIQEMNVWSSNGTLRLEPEITEMRAAAPRPPGDGSRSPMATQMTT